MNKPAGIAHGSATTTVAGDPGKEKTLVLRLRQQTENVRKDVFKSISQVGGELINHAKTRDPKHTIQQSLERVKAQYNQHMDSIQQQILSYEPKEPVRQTGQTEEEFQQIQAQYIKDLEVYGAYIDQATALVDETSNLVAYAIQKLRQYSDYVWILIKTEDPDLDRKCREYLSELADNMQSYEQPPSGLFTSSIERLKERLKVLIGCK